MTYVISPLVRVYTQRVDKNEAQLFQNGLLLIAAYCVVVQFEADIDSVKYVWIRKILIAFDCNNFAPRYCGNCCAPITVKTNPTAETKNTSVESPPAESPPNSTENGTVEMRAL